MALPLINRLPLKGQRERIDKEGSPLHSSLFTIVLAPSPKGTVHPRLAVLVSKKISNLAVDRNRLKRQVLNAVYDLLDMIKPADYLIIPKKIAKDQEFSTLLLDLKKLLTHDSATP